MSNSSPEGSFDLRKLILWLIVIGTGALALVVTMGELDSRRRNAEGRAAVERMIGPESETFVVTVKRSR